LSFRYQIVVVMKRIVLALVGVLSIPSLQAQNAKNIVYDANAEVRAVSGFTAIEVSGSIDLFISQGTEEGVAVSASNAEIKNHIRTEVSKGTLHISFEGAWRNWTSTKSKAYITFKELRRLEASGASNITTTDPITVDNFKVECSGASDFKGNLTANNLTVTATGASNIRLTGKAEKLVLEASGACFVRAYDMQTNVCNVVASGASNVRINFNQDLIAEASGGSTIYYKGNGNTREVVASGGASIKRAP